MKTLIVLSFFISIISSSIFGPYRINKNKYKASENAYQAGDRYDPTIAGVASFLVPGMGQVILNENSRGLLFFCGVMGGYILALNGITHNGNYLREKITLESEFYLGSIEAFLIWLWSIGDAVIVAKVKNMAYRDHKKLGLHNFRPILIQQQNSGKLAGGLSFKLSLD
ncbi:MAG: hypothetical protein L7U59_00210 [Flavobacteriaceae bacterium]|nr:hypothetical protein [Flavobacteriaceae bacterium]